MELKTVEPKTVEHKTVLVTGGAGFIASHLVDRLVGQGHRVTVVDSLDAGKLENLNKSWNEIQFIHADTRDRAWWERLEGKRFDEIYHYAANASVPRSSEDPNYDTATNVEGTLNLLELARAHGAKFLFISSAGVYGEPQYLPMDEGHQTLPISHYGVSKLAGELYVDMYRRQWGLDTRIIRYFNVFGPRQPRYIMFDFLRKAKLPGDTFEVLGTGEQVRTQIYVGDAVTASLSIMERGDHRPYNVGSDRTFTALELARIVLEVTGATHKRIVPTGGEAWPGDIKTLRADLTRLRELGFELTTTLEEGLQEMLGGRAAAQQATQQATQQFVEHA